MAVLEKRRRIREALKVGRDAGFVLELLLKGFDCAGRLDADCYRLARLSLHEDLRNKPESRYPSDKIGYFDIMLTALDSIEAAYLHSHFPETDGTCIRCLVWTMGI